MASALRKRNPGKMGTGPPSPAAIRRHRGRVSASKAPPAHTWRGLKFIVPRVPRSARQRHAAAGEWLRPNGDWDSQHYSLTIPSSSAALLRTPITKAHACRCGLAGTHSARAHQCGRLPAAWAPAPGGAVPSEAGVIPALSRNGDASEGGRARTPGLCRRPVLGGRAARSGAGSDVAAKRASSSITHGG
jgi:hypothetical protein